MKRNLNSIIIVFITCSFSFAQFGVNLNNFSNIKTLEDHITPYTDAALSGVGVLTFTKASSPSTLGFRISILTGWSFFKEIPSVGMDDNEFRISSAGLQGGFGTAGFEIYIRYFPELEIGDSGISYGAFGLGIKYDLTDLIPVSSFPSISAYAEYNSQLYDQNDIDYLQSEELFDEIPTLYKFDFSSINFGTIIGYEFQIVNVYGKAAVEIGKIDLSWGQFATPTANPVMHSGNISSTGFRYALGLTFYGFQIEFSGRNSRLSFGVGYGVSF